MKQVALLLTILTFTIISASAQTIKLEGKQVIDSNKNSPVLTCVPVKITKSMKITSTNGNCNGFWIQKGSITIHKFKNLEDAVGTTLTSGTYYVYPKLKKDSKKADVNITLKVLIK